MGIIWESGIRNFLLCTSGERKNQNQFIYTFLILVTCLQMNPCTLFLLNLKSPAESQKMVGDEVAAAVDAAALILLSGHTLQNRATEYKVFQFFPLRPVSFLQLDLTTVSMVPCRIPPSSTLGITRSRDLIHWDLGHDANGFSNIHFILQITGSSKSIVSVFFWKIPS